MQEKDVLNPLPCFAADHARDVSYQKSQRYILWLVQMLFQYN